jgi:hypothetical protein
LSQVTDLAIISSVFSLCQQIAADTTEASGMVHCFQGNEHKFKLVCDYAVIEILVTKLLAAARVIGEATLGFKSTDIGTHSLRFGTPMA